MSNGADLPDDVDALKAMLLEARVSISQMQQDMAERDLEIEKLKAQIDKYKRMQFGSKSEKLGRVIEELETSLEDLSASRGGAEMQPLGEDVSEQLGRIMATFKVIRTIRRKKICTCCRCIVQPAAPSQPIQRGIAHSNLLADMLVGKYGDHLPLHRQSAIAARENVTLDTASMGRWVGMCEALLDPLVQVLQRYVMSGTKLHADDTPIPVLAPGHKKPGLPGFGSMCAMTADPGRWSRPLRGLGIRQVDEENTPNNICVTSKAFCRRDAYAGYHATLEGGHVREAACHAHARRKFYEIHERTPSDTTAEALTRIGELYAIEAGIRGRPPEERLRVRQEKAQPLLDSHEAWLRARAVNFSSSMLTLGTTMERGKDDFWGRIFGIA